MSCVRVARDVSFGMYCGCLVLFLVAFSTPYWFRTNEGLLDIIGVDVHHGLWKFCEGGLIKICFKVVGSDITGSFLKATQAMMILSLGAHVTSAIMYCIWVSKSANYLQEHGITIPAILASVFSMLAGTFNAIAVIIFGRHYYDKYKHFDDIEDLPFGWSFILAILSGIGAIVIAIPTFFTVLCCSSRGMTAVPPKDTATVVITETTQPPGGAVSLDPQGVGVSYHPPGLYPSPQESYPQGYPAQPPPPEAGYPIPQPPPQQGYPDKPPRYSQLDS